MNYFTNDVLGGKINDPDALEATAVSAQFRRALFEIGPNQGWVDPAYDMYYNSLSSTLAAQLYALSNGSYVNEWSTIPRTYDDFSDWKYRFWVSACRDTPTKHMGSHTKPNTSRTNILAPLITMTTT